MTLHSIGAPATVLFTISAYALNYYSPLALLVNVKTFVANIPTNLFSQTFYQLGIPFAIKYLCRQV